MHYYEEQLTQGTIKYIISSPVAKGFRQKISHAICFVSTMITSVSIDITTNGRVSLSVSPSLVLISLMLLLFNKSYMIYLTTHNTSYYQAFAFAQYIFQLIQSGEKQGQTSLVLFLNLQNIKVIIFNVLVRRENRWPL